jgi:hypothetical protein
MSNKILKNGKKKISLRIKFAIVALITYSVLSTSAGQTIAVSEIDKNVNDEELKALIEPYEYKISLLKDDYDYNKDLVRQVTDLEDRHYYRGTTGDVRSVKDEDSEEIFELMQKISEIKLSYSKSNKSLGIYSFYGNIPNWSLEDWLKFILQTIFSIFIAAAAPFGISLLKADPEEVVDEDQEEEQKPKRDRSISFGAWEEWIKRWVDISFIHKRSNKDNNIITRRLFNLAAERRGFDFTDNRYNTIKKKVREAGVIDKNGLILVNSEEEAIRKVKEYLGG